MTPKPAACSARSANRARNVLSDAHSGRYGVLLAALFVGAPVACGDFSSAADRPGGDLMLARAEAIAGGWSANPEAARWGRRSFNN